MEKVGFFEEKPGVLSMTRLQMFLTLIFSFALTAYQAYTQTIDIVLITMFLGAAITPKIVQKFAEKIDKVETKK